MRGIAHTFTLAVMNSPLGANWKTTISGFGAAITGFLSVLAGISLTPEGQSVIAFLSPDQKKEVAIGSAIAALAFRFWSSLVQKDANVTGGNIAQDAQGKVATPQQAIPEPPQAAVPVSPNESALPARAIHKPQPKSKAHRH